MIGHVETRRSSKKLESCQGEIGGRGTRSSTTVSVGDETRDLTRLSNSPSPLLYRKRAREEWSTKPSSLPLPESISTHDHKKVRLLESHKTKSDSDKGSLVLESDHQSSLMPVAVAPVKPSKKASPLVERMRILEARYARVTLALLSSESRHADLQIMKIKKGTCSELNELIQPLEAVRQEKTTIAEKRLSLQRAQADREWHASRTCAQYNFVKARAELRSSLRQALSKQVFDVSREFRDLSTEALGVLPDSRLGQLFRSRDRLLGGPMGASLTEKDEDLILMDIAPASGPPGIDARILAAAPILGAITASSKSGASRRSAPSKGPGKPVVRRKAATNKQPTIRSANDEAHDKQSQKKGGGSQSKSEPNCSAPQDTMQTSIVPPTSLASLNSPAIRNIIERATPSGNKQHATVLPNFAPNPATSSSAPTDPSMLPLRRHQAQAPRSKNTMSPLELESLKLRDTYRNCSSIPKIRTNQQYNPWPPQKYSPFTGRQDGRNPNNDTQQRRDSALPQNTKESTNHKAMPASSDLNSPLGNHARYVNPNQAHGTAQNTHGSLRSPPYHSLNGNPDLAKYHQDHQGRSLGARLHLSNSSEYKSGTNSLPRQELGHQSMLHPFKSSDIGSDRLAHNPTSLADHSLSFSASVNGADLPRKNAPNGAKDHKGILWGGIRR